LNRQKLPTESIVVDGSVEDYPNNLRRGKEAEVTLLPPHRVPTQKTSLTPCSQQGTGDRMPASRRSRRGVGVTTCHEQWHSTRLPPGATSPSTGTSPQSPSSGANTTTPCAEPVRRLGGGE